MTQRVPADATVENHDQAPETYDGPLVIRHADRSVTVDVHLSAYFQPIDGSYRWQGRTDPAAEITELAESVGRKEIEVSVPSGPYVVAKLGEVNPWGGFRIAGRGTPPTPIPT